jgi:thymidine phosphorylase
VCRSEGFVAHSRVHVATASSALVATLNVVHGDLLRPGEAGLSESAWTRLGARAGELARFSHAPLVESLGALRAKIYGKALDAAQIRQILRDVAAGRYADIEIAALLTAFSAAGMSFDEVLGLTRGMVDVGDRLHWNRSVVADKHCVGGLPGNRTTPIVVAIVASLGVCIPKTSSRAITSPAGTADTMETLTRVDLDLAAMRRVVEREGGCVVWGGAVGLSPVDDLLIRIERALDIDSEAQLVASVLSKKIAAGSTHVVIDIPVGPTAKVRTQASASLLSGLLSEVGQQLGLQIRTLVTDGTQPVGRGIGPALEARELLAVMRGAPDAAVDLKARATRLAAEVLELAGHCPTGEGEAAASAALVDGRAWRKLEAICEAQGGLREPPSAQHRWEATASATGRIASLDNRRLSRVAKLAGAPSAKAAGILLRVRVGDPVEPGKPLFELHAETSGELEYARSYLAANPDIIRIRQIG